MNFILQEALNLNFKWYNNNKSTSKNILFDTLFKCELGIHTKSQVQTITEVVLSKWIIDK